MGVRKRGDTYIIDYYVNGQRVRETVGPNKRNAEKVLIQRKAEILSGKLNLPQLEKLAFSEAIEHFMVWSREHKKSWQDDQEMLRRLLNEFGNVRLSKITSWQIEQIKFKLKKSGLSGSRVNRYLATLSALFSRCQEWELFTGNNPVKKIRRFKESPGRIRYLTKEEIERLLENCNEQLRPVVLCALGTGMRQGEIFNLLWRDVDLEAGLIHIVNSKTNRRRDIPMNHAIKGLMKNLHLKRNGDWVFCHNDGRRWTTFMRGSWVSAIRDAKLQGVRFHDLRHTFASHLAIAGESLFAIQELLGHTTLTMTRRYSHLSPQAMRKAVGVMNGLLPECGDGFAIQVAKGS